MPCWYGTSAANLLQGAPRFDPATLHGAGLQMATLLGMLQSALGDGMFTEEDEAFMVSGVVW